MHAWRCTAALLGDRRMVSRMASTAPASAAWELTWTGEEEQHHRGRRWKVGALEQRCGESREKHDAAAMRSAAEA